MDWRFSEPMLGNDHDFIILTEFNEQEGVLIAFFQTIEN